MADQSTSTGGLRLHLLGCGVVAFVSAAAGGRWLLHVALRQHPLCVLSIWGEEYRVWVLGKRHRCHTPYVVHVSLCVCGQEGCSGLWVVEGQVSLRVCGQEGCSGLWAVEEQVSLRVCGQEGCSGLWAVEEQVWKTVRGLLVAQIAHPSSDELFEAEPIAAGTLMTLRSERV